MHTINSLLTRQGFNTERKLIINAINIRMIPNFFLCFSQPAWNKVCDILIHYTVFTI